MSSASFEYLLENAFGTENKTKDQILKLNLYERFIEAENKHMERNSKGPDEALAFAFERLRLGIGAALLFVFSRLSEVPESIKVVDLFMEALQSKSPKEIDQIMHNGVEVFENLYADVFVNHDREKVLALFERTLEAESKPEINAVLREALQLIDHIDFTPEED
jgi:hypothetical protein